MPENRIMEENSRNTIAGELMCPSCAGPLRFNPTKNNLVCEYCQTEVEIPDSNVKIEEIDYEKHIADTFHNEETRDVAVIDCHTCGAETSLPPNVTSGLCPFCGSSLVMQDATTRQLMKPRGVLPFKIEQKQAQPIFKKWLGGLWFAPNDLQNFARQEGKLIGVYIPYWTYDSNTRSSYAGLRGDNYIEYVRQTVTDDQGRTRTETVPVTRTRWFPVSGQVSLSFDDILVVASTSLPDEYVYAIEPFDLDQMVGFNEKYLSGFRAESYQKNVKEGLIDAKVRMDIFIRDAIRRDIGGDQQQISSVSTNHYNITFKHILLPIWISAYRYNNKVYRFLINGRTGKVSGERPYSVIKIVLAVIAVLIIIGIFFYFSEAYKM